MITEKNAIFEDSPCLTHKSRAKLTKLNDHGHCSTFAAPSFLWLRLNCCLVAVVAGESRIWMVESESFLDSTRRMVVLWLERGCWLDGKWLWSSWFVVE